ncbi:MAG: sporulation initiation factor Spo0A C-terminal domain-containing protein, partial [Bacilli bacterium]
LLHTLGVPTHIRGYQFIRDGVMIIYNNSNISYITKDVYPTIAEKYNTTPSRVERAIRHAIEISWSRGDINVMNDMFGNSLDLDRDKPTNSEYLTTIADRLKISDELVFT